MNEARLVSLFLRANNAEDGHTMYLVQQELVAIGYTGYFSKCLTVPQYKTSGDWL